MSHSGTLFLVVMAEQLIITATDKAGIYAELMPQIEAVVSGRVI